MQGIVFVLAKGNPAPIVPEVCDRLKCKLDVCYGWDLCRQAREWLTREEQTKWVRGLAVMWNIDPDKVAPLNANQQTSDKP